MAAAISDTIGDIDDRVRVVLGGDEILIAESWDIQESVLSQPAAWVIETGWGKVGAEILKKYPPGTPFQLFIGSDLQFTGKIDRRGATQPAGGGTNLRFGGRDALAPLESSDVLAEVSITDPTYARIVWHTLQAVGIAPKNVNEPDPKILKVSNAANRTLKAGVKVVEILPVATASEFLAGKLAIGGHSECRTQFGQTWHQFCRHYLDRAGLFLWADADGNFVLSAPNASQKPTYEIVRRRGADLSNVVSMNWDDDTTHRHSEYVVYGRAGRGKDGRTKFKSSFVDQEMVDFGLTYPGSLHDKWVQCAAECAFLARRKLAEQRRSGWRLSYTISGCTLPLLDGKGQRAVVIPETVVRVDDEELGIQADLYIETVRKRRNPGTTSELHLMRTEDLIFGGADE